MSEAPPERFPPGEAPPERFPPGETPPERPPSGEPSPERATFHEAPTSHTLQFTGSGSEYFRIWVVNLLLMLVTFGIYSAWAKVRREKFFSQHTRLAGASFDYHGTPAAILRGRIVAFGLVALSQADMLPLTLRAIAWGTIILMLPWLMQRSIRFRLANSSYRGLRFAFGGTARQAYGLFGGYALIAVVIVTVPSVAIGSGERPGLSLLLPLGLFLLYPMAHASWRQYVIGHARFGSERFATDFRRKGFVAIYLSAIALWLVVGAAMAVGWTLTRGVGDWLEKSGVGAGWLALWVTALLGAVAYAAAAGIWPFITARVQNLSWNHTTLGRHRFMSHLDPLSYVRLQLKNLFLTVLTLGLYRPFAAVATARMRLGALTLVPEGDLESILAGIDSDAGQAIGAEAIDLLGFDFSL